MKKPEETRQYIIESAEKVFRRFGFEKTTMDDVTKIAQVARRSLYNHFPKKDDLISAVAEKEINHLCEELDKVFENKLQTPLERLKTYLILRMELMADASSYKEYLRDELHPVLLPHKIALRNECKKFDEWEYNRLLNIWSADSAEKYASIRPEAKAFADMLQMTMHSLSVSFFVQEKYVEYKQTYSLLINLIVDSVLNNILHQIHKEILK